MWSRHLRRADAPLPFGRVQPVIEPIVCDGTRAASPLEGLQAERSVERDGRRCRFTNVGKSSLINSLKRAKVRSRLSLACRLCVRNVRFLWQACAVAAQP